MIKSVNNLSLQTNCPEIDFPSLLGKKTYINGHNIIFVFVDHEICPSGRAFLIDKVLISFGKKI